MQTRECFDFLPENPLLMFESPLLSLLINTIYFFTFVLAQADLSKYFHFYLSIYYKTLLFISYYSIFDNSII